LSERVTIMADGVADVRLNRPDKINALDAAQLFAIADAIERLAATPGLRCIVLSGEGRGFCVGVDLESLAADPTLRDLAPRTHGNANLVQQIVYGWRTLSVPVIAAVHGYALGAGLQIMLGADIRIAAPDTMFSLMEARWGLVPDMAGFALLRGLVRDDVARELTYTARRFDGVEAAAIGLVTRLDADPHGAAMALARTIAETSPPAVRAAKRLFALAADAETAEILRAESAEQQALLATSEHRETLAAAREGRAPVFGGTAA
jgi:enoyl-CoA hydratase/carnithine racemase